MRLNETGGLDLETASATHTAVLLIINNVVPLCDDAYTAMLLQLMSFFSEQLHADFGHCGGMTSIIPTS
jgi:hypothetical protein